MGGSTCEIIPENIYVIVDEVSSDSRFFFWNTTPLPNYCLTVSGDFVD